MKQNQFDVLIKSVLEGVGHPLPERIKQMAAYGIELKKHKRNQLNTTYEDKILNLYNSGNDLDTIVKIMSRYGTITHDGNNFDKVTPELIKSILQKNGITI